MSGFLFYSRTNRNMKCDRNINQVFKLCGLLNMCPSFQHYWLNEFLSFLYFFFLPLIFSPYREDEEEEA